MNVKLFFVLGILLVYPLFILGHEFGHVAFNDFRWTGRACLLNCDSLESGDYKFSSGTPLAGVELVEPFNELAVNEGACDVVGTLFVLIGLMLLGLF